MEECRPSEDPVDTFLRRMKTYAQNPGLAVTDFGRFVVDACKLMAHVSKPSFWETMRTSCVVLLVVALFVGMLHASDLALTALRLVGRRG
jgi:preprotein translocase subunit SecE